MGMTENRYVTIKRLIEGKPLESDFELRTEHISLEIEKGSEELIVKNILFSIDPYQLNRMKTSCSSQNAVFYTERISPGQKIMALGLGRVVESGNDTWKKGELIYGLLGWEDYSVYQPGMFTQKIDVQSHFPLSYYVSVLGVSGFTAYAGLYSVCKPRKGEKVFVSAAAGSIGNVVGQYAKLEGCYVVGCAGSQYKVQMLKEKLGFHDAFNYKDEPDLKAALKRYFPEGIDIYFDNVGGEMLEAAIANMNAHGRVAVCGVMSEYVDKKGCKLNMIDVIYKKITISGFLSQYYLDVFPDFLSATSEYLRLGRMQALEDISDGLEAIPAAFASLFEGTNIGKKMVRLTDV